jgi:meiotic recombination protein SPO11
MTDIKSSAKLVIIVEKDATFQRLLNENFLGLVNVDTILITSKGVPDLSTRKLLQRLAFQELTGALFVCFVDGDPYGIEILCVYTFGSLQMAWYVFYLFPFGGKIQMS